jgi:predicted methyltransferase
MIHHLKTTTTALLASAAILGLSVTSLADHHGAGEKMKQERPAGDLARDAGRKPWKVMEFLGVKPGMKVWDHASSTGYYTAVLSEVVGKDGMVVAQNRTASWERLKDALSPRYEKLGNVDPFAGNITEYDGGNGEFDMVFTALIYHHMHYSEASGENTPDASKTFFAKAMEMLKPGGTYVIIEHQAPDGTARSQSNDWHRASLENAISDLTAAGFEYVGSSDILANPNDPQNIHFRELTSGRDSSQRFIAKFRKPE